MHPHAFLVYMSYMGITGVLDHCGVKLERPSASRRRVYTKNTVCWERGRGFLGGVAFVGVVFVLASCPVATLMLRWHFWRTEQQ